MEEAATLLLQQGNYSLKLNVSEVKHIK